MKLSIAGSRRPATAAAGSEARRFRADGYPKRVRTAATAGAMILFQRNSGYIIPFCLTQSFGSDRQFPGDCSIAAFHFQGRAPPPVSITMATAVPNS
jgi:hypothetical protein